MQVIEIQKLCDCYLDENEASEFTLGKWMYSWPRQWFWSIKFVNEKVSAVRMTRLFLKFLLHGKNPMCAALIEICLAQSLIPVSLNL